MKLIDKDDINYIYAPIAPVMMGDKIRYRHVVFKEDIDDMMPVSDGGDFSPDDVERILIDYGQSDTRFKLGDIIKYSPTEIKEILIQYREVNMDESKRRI